MPMVERNFDPTPSSVCVSPKWCGGVLRNLRNMAKYQGQRHDIGAMLQSWSGWIRDELEKNRACVYCERVLYEPEKTERRKLWCDLPDIFHLVIEGWEAS
ncbi:hypothetical protein V8D89_010195 [Ganoderma adspersum]